MHELGRILYGSNNYDLNGVDSDKDYKIILCPDFNDLYNSHTANQKDLPAEYLNDEHHSVMDCRVFNKNLLKGNINCLEYVFSINTVYSDTNFYKYLLLAEELFKDKYLIVCWEPFISSMRGLIKNSFDRYGITRKTMSRAYFFYMFTLTIFQEDFSVTSQTWRGNNWNSNVKQMRFNEAAWMPTEEEFWKGFNTLISAIEKKIIYLREQNEYKDLQEKSETLNKQMKLIILKSIKGKL